MRTLPLMLALLASFPSAQSDSVPALRRVPTELPRAETTAWTSLLLEGDASGVPEAARESMALAEVAYRAGDYPGSIEAAYVALESAPDLPPALTLLGTTYFRLQRYGDTATCFERFLEVAPAEVWRTQALGHAYYSLGEFERARAHYERVVATERAGIDALRGRGLAELQLGLEERGIATLQTVVERDPEHAAAHTALARVLFERGTSEEARVHAELARELDPFVPRPWFLLAQIYADLEREDDALGAEARWREIDRIAQALRRLEADEELAPFDLELTRSIVAARFELGDLDGASRATLRALKRAPEATGEHLALASDTADALERLGATEWSDRWAERITAAFAEEASAWEWAASYWERRRDRLRQLEARARADELESKESESDR